MDIIMCNRAAQLCTAGADDTAADQMLGDTIHASHNNSPSSRLEEMFPSQGNITGDKEEGPSGLPSSELSELTICEVSNQLKDLMEVVYIGVSIAETWSHLSMARSTELDYVSIRLWTCCTGVLLLYSTHGPTLCGSSLSKL